MKNQILIEHPKHARYPKDMILMERNILASILSHESGQKFVFPIFQAFFPQIKNSDNLFIDKTLTKQASDELLDEIGLFGIIKEAERNNQAEK